MNKKDQQLLSTLTAAEREILVALDIDLDEPYSAAVTVPEALEMGGIAARDAREEIAYWRTPANASRLVRR